MKTSQSDVFFIFSKQLNENIIIRRNAPVAQLDRASSS